MQVEECMPLTQYWRAPRFRNRRPGNTPFPDNLYRPMHSGGLKQVPNRVRGPESATRDISGRNGLVSRRFWYFGQESPPIPTGLIHRVHSGQGHSVNKGRRPDDVARLVKWLARWPCGMQGNPIDAPPPAMGAVGRSRCVQAAQDRLPARAKRSESRHHGG